MYSKFPSIILVHIRPCNIYETDQAYNIFGKNKREIGIIETHQQPHNISTPPSIV